MSEDCNETWSCKEPGWIDKITSPMEETCIGLDPAPYCKDCLKTGKKVDNYDTYVQRCKCQDSVFMCYEQCGRHTIPVRFGTILQFHEGHLQFRLQCGPCFRHKNKKNKETVVDGTFSDDDYVTAAVIAGWRQ
jgi:hypothetical protein